MTPPAKPKELRLIMQRNDKIGFVTMDIASLEAKYFINGEFDPNASLDRKYLAPALAQLFQLTEKEK